MAEKGTQSVIAGIVDSIQEEIDRNRRDEYRRGYAAGAQRAFFATIEPAEMALWLEALDRWRDDSTNLAPPGPEEFANR